MDHSAGKEISVDAYCAALDGLPLARGSFKYFNYDKIGDGARFAREFTKRCAPTAMPRFPVYQSAAPLDELRYYLDRLDGQTARYRRTASGGGRSPGAAPS